MPLQVSATSQTPAGSWNFTLNGPSANELTADASLTSAPTAGQSFSTEQLNGLPLVQLNAASSWWGADLNIGGQMLLHIDEMVRGSAYVHGSLAGSLVKGSGGSDQGVQICLIF